MAGLFRFRLFFGRKRKFIFRLFLFYGRKSKIHFRSASSLSFVPIVFLKPFGRTSVMQRVGADAERVAGHHGRVAEGPGDLAVPGTDLQLAGHHGADARGRTPLHDGRQALAGHHEASGRRPASYERPRHRQHT